MKSVAFFNEKGGSGKTTFSVLFASWLRYKKKEDVIVMDLDAPNFRLSGIRAREEALLRGDNPVFAGMCAGNDFYDVIKCDTSAGKVGTEEEKQKITPSDLSKIEAHIRSMKNSHRGGYFILDFPGRFIAGEPFYHLVTKGLIDNIIFPIDSDVQSYSSALYVFMNITHENFIKKYHMVAAPRCCFLWNKESSQERANKKVDRYADMTEKLQILGADIIEQRIHDIEIFSREFINGSSNVQGFLRSTYCWPDVNVKRTCPYLEDVFISIKNRIDK